MRITQLPAMTDAGSPARALLTRLAAVDREHVVVDPQAIRKAITEHLRRLRLTPLSVRVVRDAESAYLMVQRRAEHEDWTRAAERGLDWARRLIPDEKWWALKGAVSTIAEGVPGRAARRTAARRARSRAEEQGSVGWTAPRTAAYALHRAVGWSEADATVRPEALRWLPGDGLAIWLPFVAAFEAGLWLFWVLQDEVVVVPRPILHVQNNRLHNPDGPAVAWPRRRGYYFWRGVEVPAWIIEEPELTTG